jgi:hypothetical protein
MSSGKPTETDRMAETVLNGYTELELALGKSNAFPRKQFDRFFESVIRYVEKIEDGAFVHRRVAGVLNGLTDCLRLHRKRLPGDVLYQADRLECIFF